MPAAWVSAAVGVYSALSSSDGGGGSSGTQQNMQAADPFSSQRFQYQQALARLMGMPAAQPDPYASPTAYAGGAGGVGASGSSVAGGIGSGSGYIYQPGLTGGNLSTAQGGGGTNFVPSDPSYNFRLQSGSEAVQRAMGAKGMNGSGNMMAALMQYGQNLGSTEYQNEFNRLAILSGAESGSPAAAGQLGFEGQQMQANTDAASLAQWNNWLQPVGKAVGGWLNKSGSSSGGGGGDGGGGTSGGGDSSYSDPFASSSMTA